MLIYKKNIGFSRHTFYRYRQAKDEGGVEILHDKNKGDKTYNTVKAYYSWNKSGDDYAKKVFTLYENSKKKP